jgi:hypothetical protein
MSLEVMSTVSTSGPPRQLVWRLLSGVLCKQEEEESVMAKDEAFRWEHLSAKF